jgi:hypothetical protein
VRIDHQKTGLKALTTSLSGLSERPTLNARANFTFALPQLPVREKGFDDALGIVEKLPLEYRDQAKQFILFQGAEQSARDGQVEKAEQWIRQDGDLVCRAYILTLLSDSLSDGKNRDIRRASELLNEVEQLSRKFDKGEEKALVLFGAAAVYSRFDPARAFDLLGEAIKAANKVEKKQPIPPIKDGTVPNLGKHPDLPLSSGGANGMH